MEHERDIDLTVEERAALEQLPRERSPSRLLEERTVSALRASGILKRRTRARRRVVLAGALAASFALFIAGFPLGHRSSRSPETAREPTPATSIRYVAWF